MTETEIPWRTDAEVTADDAEAARMLDATRRAQKVSNKADELRINQEALALIRAEKIAEIDYAGLFLDRGQLLDLPTPEPLIDKVLPRHAYAILRGRDHSFKSFVAVDWACCLATGKPWQGHQVEPVRVLYIAGEGATGLRTRIDAWEYAWGHNVPPNMLTIRKTALDMHQPGAAYDHLLDHVTTGSYGLVIVDTLRRVSGAADGNSSEMGLVVDNLDRLKQATDAGTILAVAHTDKGDHDTRGYSGIEDDADVVWAAKRDDMYLTLELTKMKDGPDGRTLELEATRTLDSLTLGDHGGKPEPNTTETQSKILDALLIMPEGGVTGPELMATAQVGKPSFYRALKELIHAQKVMATKTGRTTYYELPGLIDEDQPPTNENTHDHPAEDQLTTDNEEPS